MPTISIVVPVYKAERYLTQCVDSILSQTVSDLELILVDDGSPDVSPLICDEYANKDARVKVIHKENAGVTSARKAGLTVATATFVGFVDADDYIAPTMYEILLKAAECYGADLVECGYCEVEKGPEKRFEHENVRVLSKKEIAEKVLVPLLNETGAWSCFLAWNCWNKIYNTALLKEAMRLDDESVSIGEDMLQNIFYLTKSNCAVTIAGECNYYYRRSDTSVMRSKAIHLGEVAYMKRAMECAPQLGYTGDGFRSLMAYTLLHDLLNVMFYLREPLSDKLRIARGLIHLIEKNSCFARHSASQGMMTKICLKLMLTGFLPVQWFVLACLGLQKR